MNQNIFMVRGDTLQFLVEIDDLATNLTGAYFSCKEEKDSENYLFQSTLNNGITLVDSSDNSRTYSVTVPASATENIDEGNYYYDLQISVDDYVYTPLLGIINIVDDVTRE